MLLSITEFRELISLIDNGKPIPITIQKEEKSITIQVKTKDDNLLKPIKIGNNIIRTLGIYECEGIKFWIVKE